MLEKRIVQKYEFLISDDVTGYDVTDFYNSTAIIIWELHVIDVFIHLRLLSITESGLSLTKSYKY